MKTLESIPPLRRFLPWVLVLAPLGLYLLFVPRFGYQQNNDYYTTLHQVLDGEGFSTDPKVWMSVKANEHNATVPVLIYAANALLNHGNNRALTLWTLFLMGVVFFGLYRHLPEEVRGSPLRQVFFGFSLAAFAFTPVAAHNVAMGFSGTQWFLANALAVICIGLLIETQDSAGKLYGGLLVCGLLGVFSYTTHLAVWPALLLGAVLLERGRRQLGAVFLCGAFCVTVFVLRFETLSYHPEHNTHDGLGLAKYMAVYFGSPFTLHLRAAKILALLGALTAGWIHLAVLFGPLRQFRRPLAPWLMVQVYALGSALGTAVGRSNYGQEQALASRYATLPGLFWASLFVMLGLLVFWSGESLGGWKRRTVAGGLLVWFVMMAATFHRGLPVLQSFAARASRQEVTALMLHRGYRDSEMLRISLTSYPRGVWIVDEALQAMDHVPYDREIPVTPSETIPLDRLQPKRPKDYQGYFHDLFPVKGNEGMVRVQGWAHARGKKVEKVVLVDAHGVTRGELVVGIDRPWVAKNLGAWPTGWEGYVEASHLLDGLKAYARWHGDSLYYPLKEGAKLSRQLKDLREAQPEG